ncbi:hypothetical protein LZP73_06285 [Shewanella sp. AS16]|uniref:hypothetical protein n=1 Tax=Shewanella sp. AS16 TaxID=2907625 RepID=UPI001F264B32|nr:hypothetical protein [Shewanella sp. AS16]MCE9685825.1 hypothetical protein [Shewanella sp. AS16]
MNTIVFIDDEKIVRDTYNISMQLMFGDDYNIECLDVEKELDEMILVLDQVKDKVTYFIDEKLKHTGVAKYTGIELIEKIRCIDSKIPIYILTSAADDIDKYLGDIEFVIDKNDWGSVGGDDNFLQRFLRHINTYKDIKSEQAKRFDELFGKSLFNTLTVEEKEEFDALNLIRSKVLINEGVISEKALNELKLVSVELNEIYKELTKE